MSYEFLSASLTKKTRMAHKCTCCRGTIQPGSTMHRETGIYEGDFQIVKLCAPCRDDSDAIVAENPSEWREWEWPDMWEAIQSLRNERLAA